MYRKIVVAHNESPESHRALTSALRLAKSLEAELHVVTAMADLPAYTAFAEASDPSLERELQQDQTLAYNNLQKEHAPYSKPRHRIPRSFAGRSSGRGHRQLLAPAASRSAGHRTTPARFLHRALVEHCLRTGAGRPLQRPRACIEESPEACRSEPSSSLLSS